MGKSIFQFKTYTINENESLDDIAKKFNININEILQYNFLLRNCSVYNGRTILIPSKNDSFRHDKNNIVDNISIDFKLFFYLKDIIDCTSYSKDHASFILKSYNEYKLSLNLSNAVQSFLSFSTDKLLEIVDLIINNKQNKISFTISEIKNNYINVIASNEEKEYIKTIYNLSILWSNYIFKVFSKQFEEAELIFKNILGNSCTRSKVL